MTNSFFFAPEEQAIAARNPAQASGVRESLSGLVRIRISPGAVHRRLLDTVRSST